jgi:hypothetical protein
MARVSGVTTITTGVDVTSTMEMVILTQPGHVQRFCVILEVRLSLQRSQLFGLCVQLFLS